MQGQGVAKLKLERRRGEEGLLTVAMVNMVVCECSSELVAGVWSHW